MHRYPSARSSGFPSDGEAAMSKIATAGKDGSVCKSNERIPTISQYSPMIHADVQV